MAEKIELEVSGLKNLRQQYKEAVAEVQKLTAELGATAEATVLAAKRAAELKDTLDDSNDAVQAFTGGGKFQAVTRSLAAVAGGFSAIQGAITLAGGDAKDFEKTMVKLQAAMSLTQGLEALEDLPRAFDTMKEVAVGAFRSIKAAIGATGIGLLVVALGAIYAYWDDIKAAVSGVSAEQKKLNEEAAANLEIQNKNLDAVQGQEEILKLQGKSEQEIYQIKLDQYDQTIAAAKLQLQTMEDTKKAQVDAAKRNQEITKGIIGFLSAPIMVLLGAVDALTEGLAYMGVIEEATTFATDFLDKSSGLLFDPEAVAAEADKTIEEAKNGLMKLENERAGLINRQNEKIAGERDKAAADRKAAQDKELAELQKHLANIKKLEDQAYIDAAEDEEERERRKLEKQQEAQRAELDQLIAFYQEKKNLTEEQLNTLNALIKERDLLLAQQQRERDAQQDGFDKKAFEKKLADVDVFYAQKAAALKQSLLDGLITQQEYDAQSQDLEVENLEKKRELMVQEGESTIEIDEEILQKKLDIKERERIADEEEVERKRANEELKLQAVQAGLTLISDLTQAFLGENAKKSKAAFNLQKATSIASTTIDTYLSASKAYNSQFLPIPDPSSPVRGGIAAGIAIAAGLSRIAKIAAEKFPEDKASESKGGGTSKPAGSKFVTGGMLGGPGHDMGGIKSMMGELEGGEFVMNRVASSQFLPLLEQMNSVGQAEAEKPVVSPANTPIIKTYVVASEMSSAQEAEKRVADLASL